MLAVNYTSLRENMKMYMDKVTDDYETMSVTRKDNKNVVMLSEESYNNLMENIHVMGNKANYDCSFIHGRSLLRVRGTGERADHLLNERRPLRML